MRKLSLAAAVVSAMLFALPTFAQEVKVADPSPNGVFSDGSGNKGYVEADSDEQAIRACNENPGTPAGDQLTGYIYVNAKGENVQPTYGNKNIGAGDHDGEGDGNPANGDESHDCP
jgi:hypothetical protein